MNKPYVLGTLAVAVAFILGGFAMWLYQEDRKPEFQEPPVSERFLDDMFDDRFFKRSRDPFQEMERIREEMDKLFEDRFSSPFDRWFDERFGEVRAGSIEVEENDESLTYNFKVGDRELVDITVDVSDGYVTINAEAEDRTENRVAVSSFNQRFPVPSNVDPNSAKIDKHDNVVTITFKKLG